MISGVVFLDLKKAFDKADYELLLTKLEYIEVCDHSLAWFKFYLIKRLQVVYINPF